MSNGKVAAPKRKGPLPDLVFPVRSGANEELRYSLRSITANAAGLYRKIWIIGTGLPDWLTGVNVIEAGSPNGKIADVRAKIEAAVKHRGVASKFVLLNDDFFLMEPISEWQTWHMSTVKAFLQRLEQQGPRVKREAYYKTVLATALWVKKQTGVTPLCYQGHRPLLWSKPLLRKTLEEYPDDQPLDVIGLYPLAGAGGEGTRGQNSKVGSTPDAFHEKVGKLTIPWLSSNDQGFASGMIGGYIRGAFREPSPYEK